MSRSGTAAPLAALHRPLRILLTDLWYFPQCPSGSARLSYEEAQYLAGLGHEVWMLAQDAGREAPECLVDGKVHVLRYRRPSWARFDPRPHNAHRRRARRLLQQYLPGGVDVVHAHWLTTGAAALDVYAGKVRTCYSQHAPIRDELLACTRGASRLERLRLHLSAVMHSRVERDCLLRSDIITCDSQFTRERTRAIHGASIASRVQVFPGWVDLSRFLIVTDRAAAKAALGWPADRPVLLCLRRLVARMGLDRLIDAAARLKAEGRAFFLVIAGEGPLASDLQARARRQGVADWIRFAGRVADEGVPLMFGAADAFVLPSAALECFGLIVIEALACGRPVLATPVGAIPEILRGLQPSWLASDAGEKALAALLGEFLDGRLPTPPPAALRAFVEREFSATLRLPQLVSCALGLDERVSTT